ncbi:HD-GYP domain-containing protein [Brassicibacter mesophilus]|uniref:HD-GYP domain-containing protein n=1 Tax=Brassicibacter mesophilus TaxID=745119 RepID=UPI003D22C2C1
MPLISIDEVKTGMVLNKNVENMDTGIILLASGTVLNRRNIANLINQGIRYVDVFEKKNDEKTYFVVEDDCFYQKYGELIDSTKNVLNNVKLGKKIIVTEISDVVDDMIDEITKINNILARIRQLKDSNDYTFKHSINVSLLATMVGKWLGYTDVELKQISLAGLFHDIGKMKISDNIINKPNKLNDKEFELVKRHTIYGYNILKETIGISKNISLAALQHHEREDGSGYPLGVKSDKIHEYAKIIAVCDVFDAMTSNRVYKGKDSPFLVAEHIASNSFGILDGRVSTTFLKNISKFYVGNIVKLSTGEIGEIIYVYNQIPTRPVVKVDDKYIDLLTEKDINIIDVIN